MLRLPSSADSLLVRTNFAVDEAWTRARSAALEENSDGFRAYVQVVDDPALDGATWHQLRRAAAGREHAAVLFVVDRPALDDEHPILVVDLSAEARRPFRCVAQELWSVDNNLNIANMAWEEFADQADAAGVFRRVE